MISKKLIKQMVIFLLVTDLISACSSELSLSPTVSLIPYTSTPIHKLLTATPTITMDPNIIWTPSPAPTPLYKIITSTPTITIDPNVTWTPSPTSTPEGYVEIAGLIKVHLTSSINPQGTAGPWTNNFVLYQLWSGQDCAADCHGLQFSKNCEYDLPDKDKTSGGFTVRKNTFYIIKGFYIGDMTGNAFIDGKRKILVEYITMR